MLILAGLLFWINFALMPAEPEVPVYASFEDFQPYLHQTSDTLYVVNFWATWCKPCVKELPYFDQLASKYPDQKIKVILVSLDFSENLKEQVLPFLEKIQIQSQVLILDDPNTTAWIEKVDSSWSGAIPSTVFYSKDFREFHEGDFTEETLHQTVNKLLKP
ncbi:MAG: redoxin domain-containing protein [Bacteroidetes bacterium]|nr:redoxin domain-containing protein [Bacteroidota bacterium]